MTAHLTHGTPVPWRIVRIAAPLAIATGSFVALRQIYQGTCVPEDGDILFPALAIVFAVAFVWFASELILTAVSIAGDNGLISWLASAVLAVAVYWAIAGAVWMLNPTDSARGGSDSQLRTITSSLWIAGVLQKSGNFDRMMLCQD